MKKNERSLGSNLAKIDATTDDEIARQIAEDPDTAPELTKDFFEHAEIWEGGRYVGRGRGGRPKGSGAKELVTLRLDRDMLAVFRASGPGWQTRLNDALRPVIFPKPARIESAGVRSRARVERGKAGRDSSRT